MIAVDTNVLARFYVDDPTDPQAASQRPIARRTLESPAGVFVPVTVVLELGWVLRAFYRFEPNEIARVIEHLAGLPNVELESRDAVLDAVDLRRRGLDLADALHLTRSRHCESLASFDDRRFVRRARRLGSTPTVHVPR